MLAATGLLLACWIPWFSDGRGRDASAAEAVVALALIVLQLSSYVQACIIDPGTVDEELNAWLEREYPEESLPRCKTSGFKKPPRSHFDNVSQRLVLNMDHFCPWVGNTIGFHNRKFFILLLFYTTLSALFLVLTTLPQIVDCSAYMITVMSFSAVLGLSCMLFGGKHFHMVMRNETTIELKYAKGQHKKYDVGNRINIAQVMGYQPWLWFIPIYGAGPAGDGIAWPTNEDDENHYVAPAVITVPVTITDAPVSAPESVQAQVQVQE